MKRKITVFAILLLLTAALVFCLARRGRVEGGEAAGSVPTPAPSESSPPETAEPAETPMMPYMYTEEDVNAAAAVDGLISAALAAPRYQAADLAREAREAYAALTEEQRELVEGAEELEGFYGYNELDIDFAALDAGAESDAVLWMNSYVSGSVSSAKNEYTGLFAGKNLIMICAEGFSKFVIDPALTPTLYRLSTEGFVFPNAYQPGWGFGTTGGESTFITGTIPAWINDMTSFYYTGVHSVNMYYSMARQLAPLGYGAWAYHDSDYAYYSRDLTHPNMGYDYKGIGNGLDVDTSTGWPYSDRQMMELSVDDYIGSTPFHAYYMTVSGHKNYTFGSNAMSEKHQAEVEGLPYSDPVRAYIACQLELEDALTYLLERLEQAGLLEDTVIAMTADHYPYGLDEEVSGLPYYSELAGMELSESEPQELYRNSIILWCGGMEEPVTVDTPCCSIDVLPTLLNLFGLDYDSRLLNGRDILAPNPDPYLPSAATPMVELSAGEYCDWITDAGYFHSAENTFYPNEGWFTQGEDQAAYCDAVRELIAGKVKYAKQSIIYDYFDLVFQEDIQ